MKSTSLILGVAISGVAVLLIVAAVIGVRRVNSDPYPNLIGPWAGATPISYEEQTFSKNHKWARDTQVRADGIVIARYSDSGDWRINGDKLIVTTKKSSYPGKKTLPNIVSYRIITIDKRIMVLETDGQQGTYYRADDAGLSDDEKRLWKELERLEN